MKVRVEYGNPYRDDLLRAAFRIGKRARLRGESRDVYWGRGGVSDHAWRAGYNGWGWHRSPNGRVKWYAKRQ